MHIQLKIQLRAQRNSYTFLGCHCHAAVFSTVPYSKIPATLVAPNSEFCFFHPVRGFLLLGLPLPCAVCNLEAACRENPGRNMGFITCASLPFPQDHSPSLFASQCLKTKLKQTIIPYNYRILIVAHIYLLQKLLLSQSLDFAVYIPRAIPHAVNG